VAGGSKAVKKLHRVCTTTRIFLPRRCLGSPVPGQYLSETMKRPLRIAIAVAVLGSAPAAAVAIAKTIPIYSNDMSTAAARAQLVQVGGGHCEHGGSRALRLSVGKRTQDCTFRTPVVGANLDITITTRLLQGTPESIQRRVFVAVGLRVGDSDQYQLAVFPAKGSFQLRRDSPSGGEERTLLAKGRSRAVKDVGKANKLRLQTFGTAGGDVRVTAFVNGRKLASTIDSGSAVAAITGRLSTVSVGSKNAAKGARASFDNLLVAVPDPF
jgi:hypothetical protein